MTQGTSAAAANALLLLIFNATNWANYADNAGTTPQTQIGNALHTSDPLTGGTASTNEMGTANNSSGYVNYTRINVARTSGGWTVTANAVSPAGVINFPTGPASAGGTGVASYWSLSKSNASPPTGAQALLYWGPISPTIQCGNLIQPQLTTASSVTVT